MFTDSLHDITYSLIKFHKIIFCFSVFFHRFFLVFDLVRCPSVFERTLSAYRLVYRIVSDLPRCLTNGALVTWQQRMKNYCRGVWCETTTYITGINGSFNCSVSSWSYLNDRALTTGGFLVIISRSCGRKNRS